MMNSFRIMALLEATSITGSAKAVLEFAKEARQRRPGSPCVDVSVATFLRAGVQENLTRFFRRLGIPIDVVYEEGRFDRSVIPQLRSIVAQRHPDVIWTNSVKSHFLVTWAGLNRSCRWVAFHHGYTTTDFKMRLYNHLDRWSLQSADQVLTSCRRFRGELEQRNVSPNRIHVQHMPIRPFDSVPQQNAVGLRGALGLDEKTRVLLSVGRLSKEKGHENLIRALPAIRNLVGSIPFHVVLVGDGPERSRIERLSRSLGMTNTVTLAGQQENVNPYYAIADVFVLPSLSEGSPNVLLEAMAAGIPVVATATGAIPELTNNGRDALLVKAGDIAGLASTIARLLNDPALRERISRSAREIVLRQSPEMYFNSLASVFQSALV